jgi:hypothetical protein
MRRARLLVLTMAALLPASSAHAQRLTLTVSQPTVAFVLDDPDTTPTVSAAPIVVAVRVQQNSGQSWRLTVQADSDLVTGASSIDAAQVTWTASPAPPFQNGTLSKAAGQTMASGTGNVNPAITGSVVFRLANSWTYAAGLYSQTVVFTLSAP